MTKICFFFSQLHYFVRIHKFHKLATKFSRYSSKAEFFYLTIAELSELGISKKLSFLAKIAPDFFKDLGFLGDLSFSSVEKKSLVYISSHFFCCC